MNVNNFKEKRTENISVQYNKETDRVEITKWYANPYYGQQHHFVYDENNCTYSSQDFVGTPKDEKEFLSEERPILLAYFHETKPNIFLFVYNGLNPLSLNDVENNNFRRMIQYAYNTIYSNENVRI